MSILLRGLVVSCGVGLGGLALGCSSTGGEGAGAAGTLGASGVGGSNTPQGGIGGTGAMSGGGDAGSALDQAGTGAGGIPGGGGAAGSASMGGSGGQGSGPPMFPALIPGCDVAQAQQQADRALQVNLLAFWNGGSQYLNATSPTNGKLTGYWTYAQVFDALLDGVQRTGRYQGLVRAFYDGRAAQGWIVDYYDDQSWMTLALIRAYDLTGDKRYLDTAETIYQDIMLGWDTSCCAPHLGGIWWNKTHSSKATASNGGPVIAGVRLAKRASKPEYLDFAKKVYGFWMSDMVDQKTWSIYDHLNTDGTRGAGALTYNHGLMIGAGLELFNTTGEAHYLTEANGFAHYMITHAVKPSSAGPVLNDFGSNCEGDCAAWKGIGYRYLALIFQHDPTQTDYSTLLSNDAKAIWTLARDPATDLFSSNWAGPPPPSGGVEKQGSAAMALNLYAMLCGSDPAAMPRAAGVYEAEEANVNHVSLEDKYMGFSGFGYIAAFSKDKEGVSFDVDVAQAGSYQLTWHYAAGAGAASRQVLVGGQASSTPAFPATTAWDAWADAQSSVMLPQGKSTIELRFDGGSGSSGQLNLDRLTLKQL